MKKSIVLALCLFTLSAVCRANVTYVTMKTTKAGYWEVSSRIPQYTDSTPLARLANQTIRQYAVKTQADFVKQARQFLAKEPKPLAPYSYQASGKTYYNYAPRLLSSALQVYEYTGGAHGIATRIVFNFAVLKGKAKQIKLGDLFRPGADYKENIAGLLLNKLRDDPKALFVQEGTVTKIEDTQLERFIIEADGLCFLFDGYEVAPYAAGQFSVKLDISELGPDFNRMLLLARGR